MVSSKVDRPVSAGTVKVNRVKVIDDKPQPVFVMNGPADHFLNEECGKVKEEAKPRSRHKGSAERCHRELAERLHSIIVKSTGIKPDKYNVHAWAEIFARAERKQVQGGWTSITNAFDYWVANLTDNMYFRVTHPSHFLRHMARIEDDMKKSKGGLPTEVSEDAANLYRRHFSDLNWPKGCGDSIVRFAQAVMTYFRTLEEGAKRIRDRDDQVGRFALAALRGGTIGHRDQTIRWIERVWHEVHRWDEWSGDLEVFLPGHPKFDKWLRNEGRQAADEYCGNHRAWDKLMDEIKERRHAN